MMPHYGVVLFFNFRRGYGFIKGVKLLSGFYRDIYFNQGSLYSEVHGGDFVKFDIVYDRRRDRLAADHVRRLKIDEVPRELFSIK